MSEWKKVKFMDFIVLQRGFDLTKESIKEGLYPVVCSTSIMGYHNDYKVKGPGVVTGRSGTLGETQFVIENFWPHNTTLYVKDFKGNDRHFVYYFMKNFDIASMGGGAAIPSLNRNVLSNITVSIPDISTQHRIATILSRYDSLIENYQKQIKLLEESAQRLYKEWFIDLRFPGHENTKIVDGVPEGWEKKCVDSIYSIKYGKNLSTKLIEEKGDYPVYGANGVIGYYSEANCNEQVVLITSRGNGSGDVLMTYHKDAFITNNSFIVTPLEEYLYCQLPFTYQFLKCANFRNVRTGAAQPQLTNQSIHTIDVILPTKDIIIEFCKKNYSNNGLIINLKAEIRHLTEARDRLLPKLMSGEIEV